MIVALLAALSVAGGAAGVCIMLDALITLMQAGHRLAVVLLVAFVFGALCAAGVIFISPIVARGIF